MASSQQPHTPQEQEHYSLQEIQHMISCFDAEVLPFIPSKEAVILRARQRRLKKQALLASTLGVVCAVVGLYAYNPSYQKQMFATRIGQQQEVTLTDGTTVLLNTNTQLEIRHHLRSRELTLVQGEASFSVQHSQQPLRRYFERAFSVQAGQLYVHDIGTVFQVQKHNATDATVSVQRGLVEVSTLGSDQAPVRLSTGQSLTNHVQQLQSIQWIDNDTVTAWQHGQLVFQHTPLAQALQQFQRYHDFKVSIASPALKQIPINGQFKTQNYQQFLTVLPQVAALKVEQVDANHWRIQPK
ncbi:FecR family protein [Acinetobacter larvae]|uniref:FecR protein domain-containing protein n=1 Tax=Acinetobacter larvae TaxID=1789224 RepID=A0A1B2LXY9_9GAMM|nr:FecR domain-containing protein [Acinetobacter larvae]AOA57832.1 hypothetical protein BFG52_05340 [Acinetobacter larvae]